MKTNQYLMTDGLVDHDPGGTHCSDHVKRWGVPNHPTTRRHAAGHFARVLSSLNPGLAEGSLLPVGVAGWVREL